MNKNEETKNDDVDISEKALEYISRDFKELGLNHKVLEALKEMSFDKATEVQAKVIPVVMEGKDVIVLSKTGSGKTASFGIPIINSLTEKTDGRPKALVLTPTRELALQVCDDLSRILSKTDLKTTCVYGQHSINLEVEELDKGVDLIFGTPGRVLDHLRSATMDLSDIEYFVLDEADRMLNMGFVEQIESIIKYLPKDRQTLLLSATMPFEIMNITWQYMKDPVEIKLETEVKTVDKIKQIYYKVENSKKRAELYKIISLYRPQNLIVFCNTRWQVDRIRRFLENKGFSVNSLHGGISQSGRTKTMEAFKTGGNDILVATDVAARGIHVDDLEMVINFDVPNEKDNYVHRIGRTGRVGKSGLAVTLASSEDMFALYEIEEHIGTMISEADFPSDDKMNEAYSLAKSFYKLTKKNEFKTEKHKKEFKKSVKNSKKLKKAKTTHNKKVKTEKTKISKKQSIKNTKFSKKTTTNNAKVTFVFNGETSQKPVVQKVKAKESTRLSFWQRLFGRKK